MTHWLVLYRDALNEDTRILALVTYNKKKEMEPRIAKLIEGFQYSPELVEWVPLSANYLTPDDMRRV
jgi:hypothetical protein